MDNVLTYFLITIASLLIFIISIIAQRVMMILS